MSSSTICPTCSCTEFDIVDVSGEAVCVSCGTIVDDNNIVSTIEFAESNGGHSVVGQYVSGNATKSYNNISTNGRNYGVESRANTLANGKKKIRQIAGMLRLGEHYIDSGFRLFALALQRNFTHGRKAQTVIAACLYIVCRRERSPHLLIDFSDKLQINVYVLGGVFLKFCKLLQINLPLIDPSLYIHRFASQLNLGIKTHSIATTALRLVATMKRDWIETGRRPSGICGAALLIAARSQAVDCTLMDVMDVVNIGERTLKQRLYEFSLTPTAQLTYDQVGRLEMSRVECDPPSFRRHREKEVMDVLLMESNRLLLEKEKEEEELDIIKKNGKNRNAKRKKSFKISPQETNNEQPSPRTEAMHDEEMSRFMSGDVQYKKQHAGNLLLNGVVVNNNHKMIKNESQEEEYTKNMRLKEEVQHHEEEEDYGFENPNEMIVNQASRRAAQTFLSRVRHKSARYIRRKQHETYFYMTIERDLSLALEDEELQDVKKNYITSDEEKQIHSMPIDSKKTNRWEWSSTLKDSGVDEETKDMDEDEWKYDPTDISRPAQDNEDENEDPEDNDTFSDIDDDEIDSLLLTTEEAEKKRVLWEKMNHEYLKAQEQKRVQGLDAPENTKRKRRKKMNDTNIPPPDTAQHAIYKLKSRRINYDVIDELFGTSQGDHHMR